MTLISNKTTTLTIKNLSKGFETVYTDFDIKSVTKKFWNLINKQKFEELYNSDTSFKEMISNEVQLKEFKNNLLKLKNYSSQNQQHQEINLSIVKNPQQKNWIMELS